MARQIETAFVQQYRDTIIPLAQQRGSRLRGCVYVVPGVKGEAFYFDQYGQNDGQIITTTGGDSPQNEVPHARRQVTPVDWDFGELIEWFDLERMLIDPTSAYMQAAMWGAGRFIDDRLIASAFASANTGKTGGTPVAFPAGNQVAVNDHTYDAGAGNVSMTPGKIINARTILGAGEAEDYDMGGNPMLTIWCTQKQISNMLKYVETTSRDYSDALALTNGTIKQFMGFNIIKTQRMLLDTNGFERVTALHKSGIGLAIWSEAEATVAPRPDKKFMPYAYVRITANATRLEEARVVEIKSV